MNLKLQRFINGKEETIGKLYVDDIFYCYTLEDQYRALKVHGDTRIPAGKYELKLRTIGTKNEQYASGHYGQQIKQMHRGMLWLQDVPNFEDVLIHIGNTDKDTEGCILVGTTYTQKADRYSLIHSTDAYIKLYPHVSYAIQHGDKATIEVIDTAINT